MAADVHNKGVTWDTPNGGLVPVDRLRNDRSDSPTPGLVEGTEPGAGQEHTMFVHAQSFEDLTADSESNPSAELTGNSRTALAESEEAEEKEEGPEAGLRGGGAGGEAGEQKHQGEQQRGTRPAKEEDVTGEAWRAHRKHVFVLSEAGKPIYTRYGTEEALSTIMGVMMALVSFVEAEKNIIRSIHADGCRVVFLHKSPLVLVGVSHSSQSDRELSRELQYVYYQIVSLLTLTQLDHVFRHKQNYDLRRLLAGSEHLTDNLLRLLECDPGLLLNAVTSLPLVSVARDALSTGLQAARAKSLVFSILLAGSRLVTLVRKKDQFLHPMDLHLLFNLVGSSTSFREGEGWTPVCLPKFNTAGFFHAHISYLEPASDLCLILVSTDREDFFNLSDCRRRFLERLRRRSAYQALQEALRSPTYPVSQVGIPELWHFVYKSKSSGLYTSPELPVPYQGEEEHERLMGLYRYLHSCLHHPTRPLRSMYRSGNTENLFAWKHVQPARCDRIAADARALGRARGETARPSPVRHSEPHRDQPVLSGHQWLRALPLFQSSGNESARRVCRQQAAEVDQEGRGSPVYPQPANVLTLRRTRHCRTWRRDHPFSRKTESRTEPALKTTSEKAAGKSPPGFSLGPHNR